MPLPDEVETFDQPDIGLNADEPESQDTAPTGEPSLPSEVTFKHDGRDMTVPWDKAVELISKGQDYTHKSQELAQIKRDYAERLSQIQAAEQALLQRQQQQPYPQQGYGQYPQQQPQQQQYLYDANGNAYAVPQSPFQQQPPAQGQPQQGYGQPQQPGLPPELMTRMDEQSVRLADMEFQRELAETKAQFPEISDIWELAFISRREFDPNTPAREIAGTIRDLRHQYDQGVIDKYLQDKDQARATAPVEGAGGVPTFKPDKPATGFNDSLRQQVRRRMGLPD